MAALRSKCEHYIWQLWFLLSFFFPRLFSAVADWMSTILPSCGFSANLECRSEMYCTRLAEKYRTQKNRQKCQLRTVARLCRAISSQLRHISTIRKKLVKQQYLLHMSSIW